MGTLNQENGKLKDIEKEHPKIAIFLSNIGNLLNEQGKMKEAETQFLKVVEIAK